MTRSRPPWQLSPRQREVLLLVALGHTTTSAASALGVSPEVVKTHMAMCRRRLHARSAASAVYRAIELGELPAPRRVRWRQPDGESRVIPIAT